MPGPILSEITVAADPTAWAAAGFSVAGARLRVGGVSIEFVDGDGGFLNWTLATAATDVAPTHANGVTEIDHVVMLAPDLERKIAELESQGIELRRIREG